MRRYWKVYHNPDRAIGTFNSFDIAKYNVRKWMVCFGVAVGALFIQFDSLSPGQGFIAVAAVYYCFQVESYYRSAGVKCLKHLSTILDFALLWGVLALGAGFEYHYLGLFFINAIFLAIRFALPGWPWLLVNIILLQRLLHISL